MRITINSLYVFSLIICFCAISPTSNAQAQALTSDDVLELAMSSPIFMNESAAVLEFTLGELESARRWWVPTAAIGANSFYRNGSALTANGDLLEDITANSSSLAFEFRFDADAGSGLVGVKTAEYALEAAKYEAGAARNEFVLICMNSYISIISAQRDYSFHMSIIDELRGIENEFQNLSEIGLRPKSDVLIARTERLQMESYCFELKAAIDMLVSELQGALGLAVSPELNNEWPEVHSTLTSGDLAGLPQRKALDSRTSQAESEAMAITRGILFPELRFSPVMSGFGDSFSTLSTTNQWVASVAWSFSISDLISGGEKRKANAVIDIAIAKESVWDLRHASYLTGLSRQINSLQLALSSGTEAADVADLALSEIVSRHNLGLVEPFELILIQRHRLAAHSHAIAIKESLLKAEFRYALETGAVWTKK